MSKVRAIRKQAGYSQTEAAALADASPITWRIYEASPEGVAEDTRARCDAAVAQMQSKIEQIARAAKQA